MITPMSLAGGPPCAAGLDVGFRPHRAPRPREQRVIRIPERRITGLVHEEHERPLSELDRRHWESLPPRSREREGRAQRLRDSFASRTAIASARSSRSASRSTRTASRTRSTVTRVTTSGTPVESRVISRDVPSRRDPRFPPDSSPSRVLPRSGLSSNPFSSVVRWSTRNLCASGAQPSRAGRPVARDRSGTPRAPLSGGGRVS